MKCQLPDGTIVEATKLIRQLNQFTHWYMDKNGEPRYLIVREANDAAYMFNEDANSALTAALASGRYMIAVFTIEAAENGADRVCHLHRVSHQFPYDAFDFCKTEFVKNLDEEYTAPQKLAVADFVKDMQPGDKIAPGDGLDKAPQLIRSTPSPAQPKIVEQTITLDQAPPNVHSEAVIKVHSMGEETPVDLHEHTNKMNAALVSRLQAMNDQAEADGIITDANDPPKANIVEPEVLVAAKGHAEEVSEQAGG